MAFIFGEADDGTPISDGFDFPVGQRGQANVLATHYIASRFVDPTYSKTVYHPGEDWNGRGGGDSDLGDPIYAVSNGRVVDATYNPSSWGNIVLLEHALPDGMRVWSQYAHLKDMMVSRNQKVARGHQIGTMGKGATSAQYPNGRWVAHLHFEIRRNLLPAGNWTPMVLNKSQVLANYINPEPFIKARRPGTGIYVQQRSSQTETTQTQQKAQTVKTPVHLVIDGEQTNNQNGVFQKADVDRWFTAPHGFNGTMLYTPSSEATEHNWAEWRPFINQAGQWQLWAFIPTEFGTTSSARYQINHLDGKILIGLDQRKFNHQWAYLGTYRFGPGQGYVRLTDVTGEDVQTPTYVAFDAMCWTKAD